MGERHKTCSRVKTCGTGFSSTNRGQFASIFSAHLSLGILESHALYRSVTFTILTWIKKKKHLLSFESFIKRRITKRGQVNSWSRINFHWIFIVTVSPHLYKLSLCLNENIASIFSIEPSRRFMVSASLKLLFVYNAAFFFQLDSFAKLMNEFAYRSTMWRRMSNEY